MPAITRPSRQVSFTDLARNNPRAGIPADRLDAQIKNLIDAIHSTQVALADIRRDDGKLKSHLIGPAQIAPELTESLVRDVRLHTLLQATRAEQGAAVAQHAENNVALYAKDAESAAVAAAQYLSAISHGNVVAKDASSDAENAADRAEYAATQSQNSSTYSHAQADNAIAAKNEATQWAEYLAGPVVNPNDAPAYIAGHPFGHGLYYQPVEGYGGNAGLWSAKWWAIYAAQLVGPWSFYYLGGWTDPPIPGSVNPDTGIKVPNPIPPGSFYYDTDTDTVYFWNGSAWVSPFALAAGITSRFVYLATAGQTTFTGQDYNGTTPAVGTSPSDVHLNGVKLVPTLDYTVTGDTLTLTIPATVNSVIQWDLLVADSSLTPTGVHSFKCALTGAINGTNTTYTLTYSHPTNGPQPTAITDSAQLQVSLDGIIQEPGTDYSANAATLIMGAAPPSTAKLWAVWFATAVTIT
jgi:hypothetical protein